MTTPPDHGRRPFRVLMALGRDRAGTAAIEFAILGSTFLMILLGNMEVGYLMFLQHRLDDTTAAAARSVQIGLVQRDADDTAEKFRDHRLCPRLQPFFQCREIVVDAIALSGKEPTFDPQTWDETPIGSRSTERFCVGSAGEYTLLRISYPQPPMVGAILPSGMFTEHNGQKVTMLQSFAALKVEPVGVRRTGTCQ